MATKEVDNKMDELELEITDLDIIDLDLDENSANEDVNTDVVRVVKEYSITEDLNDAGIEKVGYFKYEENDKKFEHNVSVEQEISQLGNTGKDDDEFETGIVETEIISLNFEETTLYNQNNLKEIHEESVVVVSKEQNYACRVDKSVSVTTQKSHAIQNALLPKDTFHRSTRRSRSFDLPDHKADDNLEEVQEFCPTDASVGDFTDIFRDINVYTKPAEGKLHTHAFCERVLATRTSLSFSPPTTDANKNHSTDAGTFKIPTSEIEDNKAKRKRIEKQKKIALAAIYYSRAILKNHEADTDCFIEVFVRSPLKRRGPRKVTLRVARPEIDSGKAYLMLKRLEISARGERVLMRYESKGFMREGQEYTESDLLHGERPSHSWIQLAGKIALF